jgi:hypothetical protein
MKKFLTGGVCLAAIVATSVVLLPAAAVKIAVRLSKPRDKARKDSPRAVTDPSSSRLLTEAHKIHG